MAYTSIWSVKGWLGKIVIYAENPEKTNNPDFFEKQGLTGAQKQGLSDVIDYAMQQRKTQLADENANVLRHYVTGINCKPETARSEMLAAKKKFGKDEGVAAYHGIQSFAPNEVTPDLAHEIGVKLAERLWGDKYQVLVTTHLDTENHLHNHFVLNTVSWVDGIRYHRTSKDYHDMRQESDNLCREYGLSVIEPQGKGKHYAEWRAEKEGLPTFRSVIKEDIDRIIPQSPTFRAFVMNLQRSGYKVVYGEDVKYMKVLPPNGERFLRLSSLHDPNYTEQGIRERIIRQQEKSGFQKLPPEKQRKTVYRYNGTFKKYKSIKLHGFKALYFHYLYMLGKVKKKQYPTPKSRYMVVEMQKYNRRVSQFRFLQKYNIESLPTLLTYKDKLTERIHELTERRKPLYGQRKAVTDEGERLKISDEIAEHTRNLRELRREYRLCGDIENGLPQIQESLRQSVAVDKERVKEDRTYEHRSRIR